MVGGSWLPPGRSGDPLKWQLDLQKGWLPPGQMGNPAGVQYEMPMDFNPSDRDAGYSFLHSPPGVAAPEHAINWTPGPGRGEIHGPGSRAPIDKMNISVLPVGSASGPPWHQQSAGFQGGVGSGQESGPVSPEEDWRKAAILNDPGGLYVGMGQEADAPPPSAPQTSVPLPVLKRNPDGTVDFSSTGGFSFGSSGDGGHYREWEDDRPEYEGVIWRQRVDANERPMADPEMGKPFVFKRLTPFEIAQKQAQAKEAISRGRQAEDEDSQRDANAKLPNGRRETDAERDARVARDVAAKQAAEDQEFQRQTNERNAAAAERAANPKPQTTLVSRKQGDGSIATFPVSIDAQGNATTGPEIEKLRTPAGQTPPPFWTSPDGTLYERGADGNWTAGKGLPAGEGKTQIVRPGDRVVQPNPDKTPGAPPLIETLKVPPNWQLAHVGNKLVAFNPETKESSVVAEAPGEVKQLGQGIFLIPAGQTVKLTGLKGGDRTISGGPAAGGWASQDPTQSGPKGLSLYGTEDESAQRSFTAAAGGDPTKAQDLWSKQHQGEINEIIQAGRDPSTTRSVQEVRSPAAGGPAASAEAPPPVPSIHSPTPERVAPTDLELDAAVRTMTGRNRQPTNDPNFVPPPPQQGGWTPPSLHGIRGDILDPILEPQPIPPWTPQPDWQPVDALPVGEGQAAPPMPSMPPQRGVGAGPEMGWMPPLDPSQIVGGGNKFGQQVSMEGTHMGTDLQAFKGTPAMSPVDGKVVGVKNEASGLGLQVSIQDAAGQIHTLAHLDAAHVQPGDQVQMGQPVAAVGESGAGATGPHLDYRIAGADGTPINPEPRLGQLGQLPPHPNTVGEGQAVKGWKPKVSQGAAVSKDKGWKVGTGQTIDATVYQMAMDKQAETARKQMEVQRESIQAQSDAAAQTHKVNMRNARTAQDQQRETERFNFVNQMLSEQFKLVDAQIAYAQMASSQDVVKMQIAGQLTKAGMDQQTALLTAHIQTSASLAGTQMSTESAQKIAELQARTQLQTQGTFGQRTTAELMKTALTNPWLQQLSGMAPGYGAPGGPGASGGGGSGGILQPLLQGWNAEVPSGEVGGWGGGFEIGNALSGGGNQPAPDWGGVYQSTLNQGTTPQTSMAWLNPGQLEPTESQGLYPGGLTESFPGIKSKGILEPKSIGRGQGIGEQLASWGPNASTAESQAGFGGNAPIANAPPLPTWQQWQAMTPYERASYRTLVEMSEPWALGVQNMRSKWGAEGGPIQAPGTTQLGAMTREPLDRLGVSQNAEVFGEDPQMYWSNQQKNWSKAEQPQVQLVT